MYSPDLTACNIFQFPNKKTKLGGEIDSNEEVIAETEAYFEEFDTNQSELWYGLFRQMAVRGDSVNFPYQPYSCPQTRILIERSSYISYMICIGINRLSSKSEDP